MARVTVHLGGGNFADLEPDLYEVDRSLLEDAGEPECDQPPPASLEPSDHERMTS